MSVSRCHSPAGLPIAKSFLIALLSQSMWWATPAQAQGFFQQLFGLSSSPQVNAAPRASLPRQPIGGAPMRFQIPSETFGSTRSQWTAPGSSGGSWGAEGSGSYTTVCVRMCDGYYFPVSHRVPRSRFHRDADVCQSRCGMGDGQLFYHASAGEDMRSAVDLTGRAYARLPIAFMHRKKRVSGCGCRPEPWSVEAQLRHEGYAIAEGHVVRGTVVAGGSSGQGTLTVVAGNYSAAPSAGVEAAADAGEAAGNPASAQTGANSEATAAASSNGVADPDPPKPAAADGTRSATWKPKQNRQQAVAAGAARSKPTRMASAAPAGSRLVWPGDAR